jgi:hypothetical protein
VPPRLERCYNRQLSLPRRARHGPMHRAFSGPLAQLAEQQTLNLRVLGSIPRRLISHSIKPLAANVFRALEIIYGLGGDLQPAGWNSYPANVFPFQAHPVNRRQIVRTRQHNQTQPGRNDSGSQVCVFAGNDKANLGASTLSGPRRWRSSRHTVTSGIERCGGNPPADDSAAQRRPLAGAPA